MLTDEVKKKIEEILSPVKQNYGFGLGWAYSEGALDDKEVGETKVLWDKKIEELTTLYTEMVEAKESIDHSIDVRYEPDVIEAFNKFIKKWCSKYYPHLIDDDENDGQFMREKITEMVEGELHTYTKWLVNKDADFFKKEGVQISPDNALFSNRTRDLKQYLLDKGSKVKE